ncbi:MAG: type VII toxin-antitoxin system MntA family adenylyltransferase antitoxin [Thermodesulfobacteriota bacterium]
MKGKPSSEEIKERLAPLFKDKELQLASVFGSAVSGELKKQRSDIDLAFLFDKPVDILALTNRVIRLLHFDDVDVIDLRRASPLLRFSSVKNGKLIYERSPGLFHEFFSLTFRRYVDTKKLRDAQTKLIRHFLRERMLI